MPENIASLKSKIAKLQEAYNNKCLDLKKVKLDAQANRLKYEKGLFDVKQKIVKFEIQLEKAKHKVSLSDTEFKELAASLSRAVKEIDHQEKGK